MANSSSSPSADSKIRNRVINSNFAAITIKENRIYFCKPRNILGSA